LPKPYLDSSTIVKRYVVEPGTRIVDEIFDRAEAGELHIIFSLWNVGEVIGVLDERVRRGWISEGDFNLALRKFAGELTNLLRLGFLEIVPTSTSVLIDGWRLIVNLHIYEADALQISTCTHSGCDSLLTGDRRLVAAARKMQVRAHDVVREEGQIKELIRS